MPKPGHGRVPVLCRVPEQVRQAEAGENSGYSCWCYQGSSDQALVPGAAEAARLPRHGGVQVGWLPLVGGQQRRSGVEIFCVDADRYPKGEWLACGWNYGSY